MGMVGVFCVVLALLVACACADNVTYVPTESCKTGCSFLDPQIWSPHVPGQFDNVLINSTDSITLFINNVNNITVQRLIVDGPVTLHVFNKSYLLVKLGSSMPHTTLIVEESRAVFEDASSTDMNAWIFGDVKLFSASLSLVNMAVNMSSLMTTDGNSTRSMLLIDASTNVLLDRLLSQVNIVVGTDSKFFVANSVNVSLSNVTLKNNAELHTVDATIESIVQDGKYASIYNSGELRLRSVTLYGDVFLTGTSNVYITDNVTIMSPTQNPLRIDSLQTKIVLSTPNDLLNTPGQNLAIPYVELGGQITGNLQTSSLKLLQPALNASSSVYGNVAITSLTGAAGQLEATGNLFVYGNLTHLGGRIVMNIDNVSEAAPLVTVSENVNISVVNISAYPVTGQKIGKGPWTLLKSPINHTNTENLTINWMGNFTLQGVLTLQSQYANISVLTQIGIPPEAVDLAKEFTIGSICLGVITASLVLLCVYRKIRGDRDHSGYKPIA